MSESVKSVCVRLHAAGKTVESISRTVGLPVWEVEQAINE